jgi:hypothetical protein
MKRRLLIQAVVAIVKVKSAPTREMPDEKPTRRENDAILKY